MLVSYHKIKSILYELWAARMLVVDGWMHKAQLSPSTDHCDCLKVLLIYLLMEMGVERCLKDDAQVYQIFFK